VDFCTNLQQIKATYSAVGSGGCVLVENLRPLAGGGQCDGDGRRSWGSGPETRPKLQRHPLWQEVPILSVWWSSVVSHNVPLLDLLLLELRGRVVLRAKALH
jgi:hypothetical protein